MYSSRAVAALLVPVSLVTAVGLAYGAPFREAHVTEIVREVNLLAKRTAARPAALSDSVREGTAVRTGADSRAELMFTDQTLARVGANTVFSFDAGSREMDLGSGAVLLQVPKGAGGAKISTPAVTAAVTGTTFMFEYNTNTSVPAKLMVLEGGAQLCSVKNPEECVILKGGEMALFSGGHLTKPVKFSMPKVLRSAYLIKGFKRKLPSIGLIKGVAREQGSGADGTIVPPGGSIGAIDQKTNAQPPPPPPPPTPFRTPPGAGL